MMMMHAPLDTDTRASCSVISGLPALVGIDASGYASCLVDVLVCLL